MIEATVSALLDFVRQYGFWAILVRHESKARACRLPLNPRRSSIATWSL